MWFGFGERRSEIRVLVFFHFWRQFESVGGGDD